MTEEKTASAKRFVGEVAAQAGYAIRETRLRHMEWERLGQRGGIKRALRVGYHLLSRQKTLAKPCLLCYNLFRMNSGGPLPATLGPDMNV